MVWIIRDSVYALYTLHSPPMTHGGYSKCQKELKKTAKVRNMRSFDWQYLGYVLVGVGGSFAL
jgi:hypothetical protein